MDIENLFLKFALLGAAWVLWLLVILSLVSVAIMVERAVLFVRIRGDFQTMVARIRPLLRMGDYSGALKALEGEKSLEAAVARAGLMEADRGPDTVEETMVGVRTRERLGLERNIAFLGTVGSNAPYLGLFGTVLGIIRAFDSLAGAESANFKVVMSDISEALVATGVGLMVAIPAVVAFNVFNRRVRASISNSEALGHLVLAQMRGEPIDEAGGSADRGAGGEEISDTGVSSGKDKSSGKGASPEKDKA